MPPGGSATQAGLAALFTQAKSKFKEIAMSRSTGRYRLAVLLAILNLSLLAVGQSSGTVEGVVKDQTGGVVPGGSVEMHNPVSHDDQRAVAGCAGACRFPNV